MGKILDEPFLSDFIREFKFWICFKKIKRIAWVFLGYSIHKKTKNKIFSTNIENYQKVSILNKQKLNISYNLNLIK